MTAVVAPARERRCEERGRRRASWGARNHSRRSLGRVDCCSARNRRRAAHQYRCHVSGASCNDPATYSQLQSVVGGLQTQIASLQNQIDGNLREARAGIALAIASSGLQYDTRPGKHRWRQPSATTRASPALRWVWVMLSCRAGASMPHLPERPRSMIMAWWQARRGR
jgi:hypothetical protein